MSSNCVCGHGLFLHARGICFARINPCGCRSYEPPEQADKPSNHPKTDSYQGFYFGKRWSA